MVRALIIAVAGFIVWLTTFTNSLGTLNERIRQLIYRLDPEISGSVYLSERGFIIDGQKKIYFYEMRNLPTNCSLWRVSTSPLPVGRAQTPVPRALIILKLYIENSPRADLSNIHIGLRNRFQFDSVRSSPNIEVSMRYEKTANEALGIHVVTIRQLPRGEKAIVSLEGAIDKTAYQRLVEDKLALSLRFVISDQVNAIRPRLTKLDALEMVQRESYLFAGERIFADEKIEFRLLSPAEPSIQESYEPLPPATACLGTGGNW